MNPDLTLDPIALSRSLDGLHGLDRIVCIRQWIAAASTSCLLAGMDTTLLLNGSASVLHLYRMLDDACSPA